LDSRQSVLIVDRSEETREVLQTALERRGLRILTTSRSQQGMELAREHRPDLIVLDLETDCDPEVWSDSLGRQGAGERPPVVLLGNVRRPAGRGEFVSKPYHYGPLIRKIEELLEGSRRAVAVRDSR
jgi:DNA-binding response OmpR family regulator